MLAASPMRDGQVTFCTDDMVTDSIARLEAFKAVDPLGRFEPKAAGAGIHLVTL